MKIMNLSLKTNESNGVSRENKMKVMEYHVKTNKDNEVSRENK